MTAPPELTRGARTTKSSPQNAEKRGQLHQGLRPWGEGVGEGISCKAFTPYGLSISVLTHGG